jgi:ADP-heptose:LPS heptosyltransferase
VLGKCDAIVTSDTLAMHIAIALEIPIVVLFGSTCPQEIDLYGRGIKLYDGEYCAPCYKKSCPKFGEENMLCMKKITPQLAEYHITRLIEGGK